MESLIGLIVFLPGITTLILGTGWLLGWKPRERTVARLTGATYSLATACVAVLFVWMVRTGRNDVRLPLGRWFEVHDYSFQLMLMVDRLSMPLVALSTILVGVIGAFSVSYLQDRKSTRLNSSHT